MVLGNNNNFAPIAIFIYNRPLHTRRTLEALRSCKEFIDSPVYLFCDGQKHSNDYGVQDARKVARDIVGEQAIFVESDTNQGLANSIVYGVTRVCNEYGKVIVLEDDLIVSSYFLKYMNDALMKYEHEDTVMQVSGYMFPVPDLSSGADAMFLPYTTSWGWGTWDRAWKHFNTDALGYEKLKRNFELRNKFDLDGAYPYFKMLKSQLDGKIDSWAIWWYLTVFLLKGKVLYPKKTLVLNDGLDGSGAHCGSSKIFEQGTMDRNNTIEGYPSDINIYSDYAKVVKYIRKQNSLHRKISAKFRAYLNM